MKDTSHLSTNLNDQERAILKRKLPVDWVTRVQAIVSFGDSRIRQVLRDPGKYNMEIMDAIIRVASDYQIEVERGVLAQKQEIEKLIAS